jgi:Bacterial Ig domain
MQLFRLLGTIVGVAAIGFASVVMGPAHAAAQNATITDPALDGQTIAGNYQVQGLASADVLVDRVKVRVDGGSRVRANCPECGSSGTVKWDYTLPNLSSGGHTITAKAIDNAGKASPVATRSFTVGPSSTPLATSTNEPVSAPSSPSIYEPFLAGSWWNTPLDHSGPAPVDPNSDHYISEWINYGKGNYVKIGGGLDNPGSGRPVYFGSSSDSVCNVDGYQIHVPAGATLDSKGRGVFFDQSTNQVVGVFSGAMSNGCPGTTRSDRYLLDSGGIQNHVSGGTEGNTGHRGAPQAKHQVRLAEVQGQAEVPSRFQCEGNTAVPGGTAQPYVWPMSGGDGGAGDVPEGIVFRIKPGIDLGSFNLSPAAMTLARSLQDYGCEVVDGGNSGSVHFLLQSNADWSATGLQSTSLGVIPLFDYEFVKAGYDPMSGVLR